MSWHPSPQELYVSWNAFKQLHGDGVLSIDVADRQVSRAHAAGWFGLSDMFRNKSKIILRRMLGSSADYHTACEWGVDIVSLEGVPLRPADLHASLAGRTNRR